MVHVCAVIEDPAVDPPDPQAGAVSAPEPFGDPARPTVARRAGWRQALRRSLGRGQGGLTALAVLTGAGAGVGAIAFRYMILGCTYLFTGHRDYSAVGHTANPLVPGFGIWFVVLVPIVGGHLSVPRPGRRRRADARHLRCSDCGAGRPGG